MDIRTGQQRRFPAVAIVAVLFLFCIIPGQFWIAKLFPAMSGLARVNPSLVFLDIPIRLPVAIDLVLAPCLFFLIYPIVILVYPSRPGIPSWRQAIQRVRFAFVGLFALLFCVLSAGLIYYLVQDYLPGNVRTGINSFGINADIHLPYPGYETIHLRGSTVLLVGFVIGMWICIRKIRKEPGMQKAGQLTREQRMTPYERMMQEKRMKEKQGGRPYQAPAVTKPATSREPANTEQVKSRPVYNDLPRLCDSRPVMTFKPEAVNYMPMS